MLSEYQNLKEYLNELNICCSPTQNIVNSWPSISLISQLVITSKVTGLVTSQPVADSVNT